MTTDLSRRSLFKGLMAVSALPFLPAVPVVAPAAPLVANTLNPFAPGNTGTLTRMILALLDDQLRESAIGVLRSVPSFRIDLLDGIGADESVAKSLTDHLGDGDWSEWEYTAGEVREAIGSLERRDALVVQAMGRYVDYVPVESVSVQAIGDGSGVLTGA